MIEYIKNLIEVVKSAIPIIVIGDCLMVEIAILFDYHYGILRRRNR